MAVLEAGRLWISLHHRLSTVNQHVENRSQTLVTG
jgi:hypothetical protein